LPDRAAVEAQIPRLADREYRITSPRDVRYNCFAWAVGDAGHVWSPSMIGSGVYWPAGIVALPSMSGVIAAYEACGYEVCASADAEEGFDKIAVFTDATGEPTHAARQLATGSWTSKLGDHVDIEHDDVAAVGGGLYGEPSLFMRRVIVTA
jgi:hypothetical protein